MTASCVYLWILRSFSEQLFFRAPLGNCLFHLQVAEFQAADTVENIFTGAFQALYKRTRSSHSKAFIYLKFIKIICEEVNSWWSCEMSTCKFTKKLFHTSSLMYFAFIFSECITITFSEGALKVCDSTIFFRKSSKYKQKIVLLVIYIFNCNSSKSFSSCWIRHQINWSSSFLAIQRLQEHLFFAQLVYFAMYFFKKPNCSPSW